MVNERRKRLAAYPRSESRTDPLPAPVPPQVRVSVRPLCSEGDIGRITLDAGLLASRSLPFRAFSRTHRNGKPRTAPWLQWRHRAGVSPASLFSPTRLGAHQGPRKAMQLSTRGLYRVIAERQPHGDHGGGVTSSSSRPEASMPRQRNPRRAPGASCWPGASPPPNPAGAASKARWSLLSPEPRRCGRC